VSNASGALFSVAIVSIGIWLEKARKKRAKSKQLAIKQQHIQEYSPILSDDRLPTIAKNGFALVDIAKSACTMDYINPLPSISEKNALAISDMVKLKFLNQEDEVERLWVEILHSQKGIFKGRVANDSILFSELGSGEEIWFHANHIFEIQG
jgi:hypothetical protein